MSKHTPGPWGRNTKGNLTNVPLRAHHCERLGFSVCFVSDERNGEPEANARLIAAAPELLEALTDIVRVLDVFGEMPQIAAIGRAAIAKATGEA